jgi:hypothetical protein
MRMAIAPFRAQFADLGLDGQQCAADPFRVDGVGRVAHGANTGDMPANCKWGGKNLIPRPQALCEVEKISAVSAQQAGDRRLYKQERQLKSDGLTTGLVYRLTTSSSPKRCPDR